MGIIAYYFVGVAPLKKWTASLILLPISLYYLLTRGNYTLIDNADLVIHEAGHFFFIFFGNFIYALGGTLMQIIFPLFLAFYFWQNDYRTGFQIMIAWLGQNWINISVYVADAQVRQLRLLGNGKHDWFYLLGELGIREYCVEIGWIFMGFSTITFLIALSIPLFYEQ
ncbi:MAG: hypothetical protein KDH95_01230 [Calditrichaeota bacterium]|nr:hypothetical protein [Calditrichota bacterium]MCB0266764.1 hypothetical protein [Calditrichota bacterium]MCB9066335.1 hypothetical protein [Calditrichia bacterium]